MSEPTAKPCLVQTGQGFSVSYNGRFLYSKYAPAKAIVQTVQNLTLLPGTLILCASPCLWHGLRELLAKLPAQCFVLGLEADTHLHALAQAELEKIALSASAHANTDEESNLTKHTERTPSLPVALLACDELLDIVEIIAAGKTNHGRAFPAIHTFRRAMLLEMSGGTALYADLYKQIDFAAENAIATFWKNRVTLTKFGRLFSRNVFRNLMNLPRSAPLVNFLRTVTKPIVVFGAGESAGHTIATVPRAAWKHYFVLAVDAALPVLLASGILPDGIVAVESQLAIEKAYIGYSAGVAALTASRSDRLPILFADFSSRQQVTNHTKGAVSYFASQFANTHFLADLQANGLLPPAVPALGSVGLTATYLALQLRAKSDIPVYVTGLDFSFSLGATHTRGSPAHIARLNTANRLHPLANYDAAFRLSAKYMQGKNGAVYTDQALSGYAEQFAGFFRGAKNLFDCGESGLGLGIPVVALDTDGHGCPCADAQTSIISNRQTERSDVLTQIDADGTQIKGDNASAGQRPSSERNVKDKISAFFAQEKVALERLKDLLMHGDAARAQTMTVAEEISSLLGRREYLYLHFPDGYECKANNISFLKRVRSEIDFFLKDIDRQ